ncbi:MAG: bis(5'-nucleosyl)-tetraphosphatase (symmetrical) YqeK [Clostridia bacterium]|nr:bis(5'-nucleosyl)-tetraphosphatase (symmetrical) YqeK [Clostridia bacterium]
MITENMLSALRSDIENKMSQKRYRHTAEVEKMAARLGELYAPEKIMTLRAAALLHDITKEYSTERQIMICAQKGLEVTKEDVCAPKTFHARTAAALIPELYPEFAEDDIISAVRWHTTGRRDMSICEKLVYLADYIDMSRTFEDCVRLREYFFSKEPEKMTEAERLAHLNDTLIMSFDMTVKGLIEDGTVVSADTFEARNWLISEK